MARPHHDLDLLIVSPGNNRAIYQDLAKDYAAIEPPIWAGLLANHARSKGFGTAIIDQEAEGLAATAVARRVRDAQPHLTAVVVYGQQPSASTQNMTAATAICQAIRQEAPEAKVILIGGHVSALPQRSLQETPADFVCQGEGPATLDALLAIDDLSREADLAKVPGLWRRGEGGAVFTSPAAMIPEKELPRELPGQAWDMLPMQVYRAHNWHCFQHIGQRQPYASIYTSLGCPYKCTFCCINAPFEKPTIRCWDPKFVIGQLEILARDYGIKNIKIADEMFVLNESHVLELCDLIIERGLEFNFWAYARVDTVKDKFLEKLKRAGFHWLCLGIESGSKHVRDGVQKGRFQQDDIRQVVRKIQNAGIYLIGNYIFGLPDDDYDSMQDTFNLSLELNCEMANFYSGMAYPGSKLYHLAQERGWALPEAWEDYSQHSYRTLPLPTEHLTAGEVLSFRDWAWMAYFTSPRYHGLLRSRFGQEVVDHVQELTKIRLRRQHAA